MLYVDVCFSWNPVTRFCRWNVTCSSFHKCHALSRRHVYFSGSCLVWKRLARSFNLFMMTYHSFIYSSLLHTAVFTVFTYLSLFFSIILLYSLLFSVLQSLSSWVLSLFLNFLNFRLICLYISFSAFLCILSFILFIILIRLLNRCVIKYIRNFFIPVRNGV